LTPFSLSQMTLFGSSLSPTIAIAFIVVISFSVWNVLVVLSTPPADRAI
jgi:hypothetical protein